MSNRKDAFVRGMAEGAMKKGLDKVTAPITGPVAQSIVQRLEELHPGLVLTEDMIHACVSSVVMMGLGEMAALAGPHLPDGMTNKAALGAEFARKYAGEKFGAEIIDLAMKLVPLLLTAFKDVSEDDMSSVLDHSQKLSVDESVSSQIPVGLLLDHTEVQEQEVLYVEEPKRRKK